MDKLAAEKLMSEKIALWYEVANSIRNKFHFFVFQREINLNPILLLVFFKNISKPKTWNLVWSHIVDVGSYFDQRLYFVLITRNVEWHFLFQLHLKEEKLGIFFGQFRQFYIFVVERHFKFEFFNKVLFYPTKNSIFWNYVFYIWLCILSTLNALTSYVLK